MKDPFPIPPIPALSEAVRPWAEHLGFSTLPLHIHEVLITAASYQLVFSILSPFLSNRLFPAQYSALSRRTKLNWDVHVVSLVQSTTINALALWVIFTDREYQNMDWQERLWGYDGASAMIQSLAAGYFVWDLVVTLANVNIFGVGMLAHAVCALTAYSLGFRPFVNYYSCNFILWELSSPFLNIHWFFDKLGMTGSKAQLYNGILLISVFFFCRLVWGTYNSFQVARDMWYGIQHGPNPLLFSAASELPSDAALPDSYSETMVFVTENTNLPVWLAGAYFVSNVTLNSLNFYWFVKMIEAIRKRFDSEEEPAPSKPGVLDMATATATGANGISADLRSRARKNSIIDGDQGDQPPPT